MFLSCDVRPLQTNVVGVPAPYTSVAFCNLDLVKLGAKLEKILFETPKLEKHN